MKSSIQVFGVAAGVGITSFGFSSIKKENVEVKKIQDLKNAKLLEAKAERNSTSVDDRYDLNKMHLRSKAIAQACQPGRCGPNCNQPCSY